MKYLLLVLALFTMTAHSEDEEVGKEYSEREVFDMVQFTLKSNGTAFTAATRLNQTDCGFTMRLASMWVNADLGNRPAINEMNKAVRIDIRDTILSTMTFDTYTVFNEEIESKVNVFNIINESCVQDESGNLISAYAALLNGISTRMSYIMLDKPASTPYEI